MRAITVDTQAVQRHWVTILECVKDVDASIRKRALELVYLLVNDTNVKPLTKELVDYLDVADPDFKEDLTVKICSITEKFSEDKLWYLDLMFKVYPCIKKKKRGATIGPDKGGRGLRQFSVKVCEKVGSKGRIDIQLASWILQLFACC